MRYLFLILIQIFSLAYAQHIAVPMTTVNGDYGKESFPRKGSVHIDASQYSGYDTLGYEKWGLREIIFNNTQKLKEMGIDYTYYMATDPTINPKYVFDGIIPRNSIGVFVAIKGRTKYVTIDQNGNKDFSDDQIHTFHLDQPEINPEIEIEIDYYDGQQLRPVVIPFEILASVEKEDLDVAIRNRNYKQGIFQEQGEQWTITVDNRHKFIYPEEVFHIYVDTADKVLSLNDAYIYYSKDAFPIGRNLYTVDRLMQDTLYLTYAGPYSKTDGAVNRLAPDIQGKELMTGGHFSLYDKRGQYVLLDFWGSWCRPCVKLLPDLVAAHDRYERHGLEIVSVAWDRKEDLNKLKNLITENKLAWEHIFVEMGAGEQIIKDYKVRVYPTTLLIDPDGKVVLRGTGKESLMEIERYLEDVYRD